MSQRVHGSARASDVPGAVVGRWHALYASRKVVSVSVSGSGDIAARLRDSLGVADLIPVREGVFGIELKVTVLDLDDPRSVESIPGRVHTVRLRVREA